MADSKVDGDDPINNHNSLTLLVAWQCLQNEVFANQTSVQKAQWLMKMGLSRSEAATALGTTDNSLRVMIYQSNQAKNTKSSTVK